MHGITRRDGGSYMLPSFVFHPLLFLKTMASSILHSSQAKSIGGRDGRIESDNRALSLELTMPRHLGGRNREGATNPEQLFAAGYAACFGNAIIHVARQAKLSTGEISIDAKVDLALDEEQLAFLGVSLTVNVPGVDQAQAEDIVARAHRVCPFSRAIKGNVAVNTIVTSEPAANSQQASREQPRP